MILALVTPSSRSYIYPVIMEIRYSFDHYTESWIEVSSRPSSSSLSSAAPDDGKRRGLGLQHDYSLRRKRRLTRNKPIQPIILDRAASTAGSSQEEYDESESESDRVMTSSNEGLEAPISQGISPAAPASSTSEEMLSDADGDADRSSTTLGVINTEPAFTPQPNAFSHPPKPSNSNQAPSAEARNSYFPSYQESTRRAAANSYPDQRPRSHTPYNVISPSHHADHDAALRASLSTLLSCAAAARGLPKRDQTSHRIVRPPRQPEPMTLHMVPESALTNKDTTTHRANIRRNSTASVSSRSRQDKGKRKASLSKDRREVGKKCRASYEELAVTPTLMTWVVGAGVVVLFSAISFSAGYAIGKEVGRMETGAGVGENGLLGGKEMGRGLRRLRWGSAPTVVRV